MILQALKDYYDLKPKDGDDALPPSGYSAEKISFLLVLSPDGHLVDEPTDLRDVTGRKPTPRTLIVPQPEKRAGKKVKPSFLWDNSSYVLGVDGKGKQEWTSEQHGSFRQLHREVLADADDEGLLALAAFLERWVPAGLSNWTNGDSVLDTNLVFRLDGDQRFLHERPAAKDLWSQLRGGRDVSTQTCLVTGEVAPVARLHPAIKGVKGGQLGGGSIVSFNNDAFVSYGKSQGLNAPVSEQATFAYTTALNQLLCDDSRNRVRIADASTVFWAEGKAGAALAEPTFFAVFAGEEALENEARALDDETAGKVGSILQNMAEGRPINEAAPDLDPETRFFVLGLAPNAARISIRFWHVDSLGKLYDRFRQHYDDLRLDPPAFRRPPAIWRLLIETAVGGKRENIPSQLAGEVMRAILTGRSYPRTLLSSAIMRMRSDRAVSGARVAIVKACLARQMRHSPEKETMPVSLDIDTTNPGYRLGRLFAVLESSSDQRSASRSTLPCVTNITAPPRRRPLRSSLCCSETPSIIWARSARRRAGSPCIWTALWATFSKGWINNSRAI